MSCLAGAKNLVVVPVLYVVAVMVVVQARQLNLPQSLSSSLSSPQVTSLLFDPHFLSLALMHSDSSFSLYPSISPFSLPSLPPPPTLIPPRSSSATFLRLHHGNPNSTPRLLFLVCSPYLGGAAVLLRFWILRKNQTFTKPQFLCNQRDLKFDENKSGVVFNVNHGVSIKLVGAINVFALHSVSNRKIWVFSVKTAADEDDGVNIKLMKCAVIDCSLPVFSISVSFGFLILGENNGVRVFALKPLVRGRVKKNHRRVHKNLSCVLDNGKLEGHRLSLPNGGIPAVNASEDFSYPNSGVKTVQISSNGHLDEMIDKHSDSTKLRSVKLRQDCREGGACFVAFKGKEAESLNSSKMSLKSAKAISIQVLSPNKFLILDSVGDLHLLCLSNPVRWLEIPCHMKQLTLTMKVQNLAVLPDILTRAQTIWISDGHHTVHTMAVSDMDTSVVESDRNEEEKLMQISVIHAIFASEKIQEIIPLSANAILILGQGSIFAYAIS